MRIRNALVISDLHLGSDLIAQYRGFESAWDFWLHYQDRHNSQIKYETQPVFILGDIAINEDWLEAACGQLRGRLHFVLGNHDVLPMSFYVKQTARSGGSVNAMVMLPHQKKVLTHFPVHPSFFDGNKAKWLNYNGHLHTQVIDDPRYIGCSYDRCIIDGYNGLRPL